MRVSRLLAVAYVAAGMIAAPPAAAHGYGKGDINVRHPWTRTTAPGTAVAAGYMELRNSGRQPDRLIGASSPAAESVELHLTVHEGGVVSMRKIAQLEIPARQRVALRPGGPHLMIMGLKKAFVQGDRVPLTLRFERAGELQVMIEVQAADSKKPHH